MFKLVLSLDTNLTMYTIKLIWQHRLQAHKHELNFEYLDQPIQAVCDNDELVMPKIKPIVVSLGHVAGFPFGLLMAR